MFLKSKHADKKIKESKHSQTLLQTRKNSNFFI